MSDHPPPLPLNLSMIQSVVHYEYFEVVFHCSCLLQVVILSLWFSTLVWSPTFEFKIWSRLVQWLLIYSTIHILSLSSIQGHLPCMVILIFFYFSTLVWSYKLKFKIWSRPDQWLLKYSYSIINFEVVFYLRSSFMHGTPSFYIFVNFGLVT